eukprot:9316586-Lingulodinium_polyedra.AAC.1
MDREPNPPGGAWAASRVTLVGRRPQRGTPAGGYAPCGGWVGNSASSTMSCCSGCGEGGADDAGA